MPLCLLLHLKVNIINVYTLIMSRCVSEIFGDMIYVCVVVVCEWEITKSVVV